MRSDSDFEKFIKDSFESLPHKAVRQGDKRAVWLKIEKHFSQDEVRKVGFWNGLLLKETWSKVLAIVLIVLVALSLAGGAAKATPGETLYPVKKAAEKVEQALATNQEAKVRVNIKHAKRRLEEIQILVSENKQKGEVVTATLNELTNTTLNALEASGTKSEFKNEIVKLANDEQAVLGGMQEKAQGEVKEAVQKAILITKESLTKLTADDKVKGAQATSLPTKNTGTSTSTAVETTKTQMKALESKEGAVQSKMQIQGVIRVSDGQGVPVE